MSRVLLYNSVKISERFEVVSQTNTSMDRKRHVLYIVSLTVFKNIESFPIVALLEARERMTCLVEFHGVASNEVNPSMINKTPIKF